MRYMKYVVVFLIVLVGCSSAQAQCTYWYSLNYAEYSSSSYDGTYIYTAVLTDGSANMGVNSNGCPDSVVTQMQQAINSATHQPGSYNQLGSVGGWGWGDSSCVSCYISYENDQQVAAQAGQIFSWQTAGEIDCSVGGTIFYSSLLDYIEVAYTHSIQTGVRSNCFCQTDNGVTYQYCDIGLSNWCSYSTTPPDATITQANQIIVSPYDNSAGGYWNTLSLLGRFSTTGPFTVYIVGFGLNSDDTVQRDCTAYNLTHGGGGATGP